MNRPLRPLHLAGIFLLLAGWIFFLRASSFGVSIWNVDEGIHAAVATTLNHGGVLYRDAIDQRTPVSYHVFAAIFAVCGDFNLPAVRAFVALMITATAFGVFLLARRAGGLAAGALSAFLFAAFSTNLLVATDAFAAHTEWFAIFFTTGAAWLFWRLVEQPTFGPAVIAGAFYALAFLSKQPALLDLGAPLAVIALLAYTHRWTQSSALRVAGGILAGFALVVGVVAAYFAAHGALGDAVFYAWTYNVKFYGPEISALDRGLMAFMPLRVLLDRYPVALTGLVLAVGAVAVQLVQLRPSAAEASARPWRFFLLAWSALAFAGAASGGRGFEHYAIQCLPPFALFAGSVLAGLGAYAFSQWREGRGRILAGAALGLIAAVAVEAGVRPLFGRSSGRVPRDPAERVAEFVRAHSTPDETLFVWGYNPDIHLYAQRRPASRFVYCSFLTGLIPWTNLAPEKDTAYAIVPGAMETLLGELEANRPAFIIDCSPGTHRHFEKYPLKKFPALQKFIAEHYVVVDAGQFVPQGFRLHMIRDSFRRKPFPIAAGTPEITPPPAPGGAATADLRAADFDVFAESSARALQRLELLVDGTVVDGVSFPPAERATITLPVDFRKFPAGRHELVTRVTFAGGATATSPALVVTSGTSAVEVERQERFSLSYLAARLEPLTVQAPYGPDVHNEDGRRLFFVHAPSLLAYALDGKARRLSGSCGMNAGAYAPENKAPTDGAGFRIELVSPEGKRTVLLERLLRPAQNDWERGPQKFAVDLPPHQAGSRLELSTNNGPAGNGACDWTYWTDLLLDATN